MYHSRTTGCISFSYLSYVHVLIVLLYIILVLTCSSIYIIRTHIISYAPVDYLLTVDPGFYESSRILLRTRRGGGGGGSEGDRVVVWSPAPFFGDRPETDLIAGERLETGN